jgi:hypothetical protein
VRSEAAEHGGINCHRAQAAELCQLPWLVGWPWLATGVQSIVLLFMDFLGMA